MLIVKTCCPSRVADSSSTTNPVHILLHLYKGSPSAGTKPNPVEVEDNPVEVQDNPAEVEDNPVEVEDTEDNNGGRYIRDNGYDAKAAECRRLQLIGITLGHFDPSWC